jgi:hypothetical protein
MANNGIPWIDYIFDISVRGLFTWAKFMGISYEEINVWLFCIAWPIATLVMLATIVMLWRSNRVMREQLAISTISPG